MGKRELNQMMEKRGLNPQATISEDGTVLVLTGVDLDVIRRIHYGLNHYNGTAPGHTDTEAVVTALNPALAKAYGWEG